jgi:hypothetical protein
MRGRGDAGRLASTLISRECGRKLEVGRFVLRQTYPAQGHGDRGCAGASGSCRMSQALSAVEILNREFLEVRCKILDLAAALDRLERAEGSVADDPRVLRLREALVTLQSESEDRAEQVQMIFSRTYDDAWQDAFKLTPR